MKTHTLVAVVALAGLAAGSLPSQAKQSEKAKPATEKPAASDDARLQAANDALRAKIARLEAENRRLKAGENSREQIDRAQVALQMAQLQRVVRDVRAARPAQLGLRLVGEAPRLDVMLPKGIQAGQLLRCRTRRCARPARWRASSIRWCTCTWPRISST